MIMKLKAFLVLLSFCLLGSGTVSAIPILNFASMKVGDQADYVTTLVEGAAAMLKAKGQPDQAEKTVAFFKDASTKGGVTKFAAKLKEMEGANVRNSTNPNNRAHVYQVEDAMEATLKDEGIMVPASYLLTVNKDFTPISSRLPANFGH
jgi:hypothetical protein